MLGSVQGENPQVDARASNARILSQVMLKTKENPQNPALVGLTAHDLGRLDRIHLLRPSRSRLELAHRANLVGSVPGNANVVVALKHALDVANLKL